MNNFIISFNVIFPICIYLTLGYIMRRTKIFDDHTVKKMNATVFKVFLPTLLFYNIYQTDIGTAFNPKLCIYAASCVILTFLIAFFTIPLIEKDKRKISVIIQGIFRSNFVIFGLPVVTSLYIGKNTGTTAVLIAIITPIFNALAVFVMEYFRGEKLCVKNMIKSIIKNPLIISSVIGASFILLKIKLPVFAENFIEDLSKVGMPLALILLGATFTIKSIKGYHLQILIGLLGRLIIIPIVFITIGVLLGFRNMELASLIALFASPTAVSSFIMAEQMDADSTLAGHYIVLGSIFSMFTVFFFVLVLKNLSLI